MRIFSCFVLFLLACSCDRNKPSVPDIYCIRSFKEITFLNDEVYLNKKRYSGYLFELFPSQDTMISEGYINGKLSGMSKKWYPNRQLMEERFYVDGRKEGRQVSYWQNGNKRFEFNAKNDAYEGELREWNYKGNLSHLAHYKAGQEQGIQKVWYDNGKIKANYVIINGKRYGLLGTKNCKNVSDSIFVVK
jgi:antitoxin component YwqK of YwqJK toxin-antitoxin module